MQAVLRFEDYKEYILKILNGKVALATLINTNCANSVCNCRIARSRFREELSTSKRILLGNVLILCSFSWAHAACDDSLDLALL